MKRIEPIALLMAVFAITFFSCNKEEEEIPGGGEVIVDDPAPQGEIIQIIGTIGDDCVSKTQYTEDYEFSWTYVDASNKDEIMLIVENGSKQDHYRLYADASSKSTTFSGKSLIGAAVSGTWKHTGFAIYPTETANAGIRRKDYLTYGYNGSFSNVTVTLSSSYSLGSSTDSATQLACTPLVGNRVGTTNEYVFSTAVGILMITLTNVPASATGIRITSPSTDAPLSGTFTLDLGSPDIKMTNKISGGQSRTVSFTPASAGTYTFYIPVPIGTIPLVDGKGLKIELLDGTSHPVFSRSYTKALTIARNTITPVTLASPDWKKLGTGEFIDNFLFGKIAGADGSSYSDKIDIDTPDYVPVVIEQNVSDPTQYRLVEPYKTAREQFGYSPRVSSTPDKYLYFTTSSTSDTVTFHNGSGAPYVTGMIVDSGNKNIQLKKKPLRTSDKLLDGTYDDPKVIQLDPIYQYTDESDYYHNDKERGNMFHLVFPRAIDEYNPVITLGSGRRNVLSSFHLTTVSPRVHLLLSQNNAVYTGCNWTYNNGGTFETYDSDQTLDWSSYISSSGTWYLTWHVYTASTIEVLRQGCIKFEAISSADAANIDLLAGTYLRDINVGTYSAAAVEKELNLNGGNTITIEESDDLSQGLVMITGFAGYNYNLLNSPLPTDGLVAGRPLYGTFNGTVATFPYKDLTSSEAFYTNGSTPHYISAATKNVSDIAFNYSSNQIVAPHRWLADSGGSTVGTYRIYWQDYYTAYKTSGQIALTGDMITASSTQGSDDTSHLVDKDASTIWHSVYSGTHDLDENYGIYLDIDLGSGNTVTNFTIMFQDRNTNSWNYPTKYKVYGYNEDSDTWVVLTGESSVTASTGTGVWNQCRITGNETAYQIIRLSIVETDDSSGAFSTLVSSAESNHGTTHLAELQLWEN